MGCTPSELAGSLHKALAGAVVHIDPHRSVASAVFDSQDEAQSASRRAQVVRQTQATDEKLQSSQLAQLRAEREAAENKAQAVRTEAQADADAVALDEAAVDEAVG